MPYVFIHTDVQVTRRKAVNHVFDENDTLLFSSASLHRCIDWAAGTGTLNIILAGELGLTKVSVNDVIPSEVMQQHEQDGTRALLKWLKHHG